MLILRPRRAALPCMREPDATLSRTTPVNDRKIEGRPVFHAIAWCVFVACRGDLFYNKIHPGHIFVCLPSYWHRGVALVPVLDLVAVVWITIHEVVRRYVP